MHTVVLVMLHAGTKTVASGNNPVLMHTVVLVMLHARTKTLASNPTDRGAIFPSHKHDRKLVYMYSIVLDQSGHCLGPKSDRWLED